MITKLKYGNTNTFFVHGERANLLIDTDYAGTLTAFFKEIKRHDIQIKDVTYILATHYHPDHIGLIGELTSRGAKLLLIDTQTEFVHFSDRIFKKDTRLEYVPIDESKAVVIRCGESREFLRGMGIDGEIISTPSHSQDSVSLVLDSGVCVVGDLEPIEHIEAYENNVPLKEDWQRIMSFSPKRILYAHANEKVIL
ncbi:MAG: MBL fold metallo-hydrolase [Oscillospiraceae bacterium]|nr:MBL fold metallo-hydrolase [Oscillospiraceae bacterium]